MFELIFTEKALKSLKTIPKNDVLKILEKLDFDTIEDFFDYLQILKVKSETTKWYSLAEVKHELGI